MITIRDEDGDAEEEEEEEKDGKGNQRECGIEEINQMRHQCAPPECDLNIDRPVPAVVDCYEADNITR